MSLNYDMYHILFTIRFIVVVFLSLLPNCKVLCGPTLSYLYLGLLSPFPVVWLSTPQRYSLALGVSFLGLEPISAICTAISFLTMHKLLMPTKPHFPQLNVKVIDSDNNNRVLLYQMWSCFSKLPSTLFGTC